MSDQDTWTLTGQIFLGLKLILFVCLFLKFNASFRACQAVSSVTSQKSSPPLTGDLLTESHLYFRQFAPNGRHKIENAAFTTGKPDVISEQSKQEDMRS